MAWLVPFPALSLPLQPAEAQHPERHFSVLLTAWFSLHTLSAEGSQGQRAGVCCAGSVSRS